jgi:hypothetical protein
MTLPLFELAQPPASPQSASAERGAANLPSPASSFRAAQEIRKTKKQLVEEFFTENLGKPISSQWLHGVFGSSVRTRISDVNKDPKARVTILNETKVVGDQEQSTYTSELRSN